MRDFFCCYITTGVLNLYWYNIYFLCVKKDDPALLRIVLFSFTFLF